MLSSGNQKQCTVRCTASMRAGACWVIRKRFDAIQTVTEAGRANRKSGNKTAMASCYRAIAAYFKSVASAILPHRGCVSWSLSILRVDRKRISP